MFLSPRSSSASARACTTTDRMLLKGAYFEMLRDQAKVENFFAEQIFKSDAH